MTGPVAITGIGAVSALGEGCQALWRGLVEGLDGIRPIERFDPTPFTVHLAALVPGHDQAAADEHLCLELARRAAAEAWREAQVEEAGLAPDRLALVLGTSIGPFDRPLHGCAERLADELAIEGPRLTVSTACTSSTVALGLARDLLAAGEVDLVLAGGADQLTPEIFAGFHALGVLSAEKCAPFSEPAGTTLGEGAGFLVLELASQAGRRGASPRAWLSGYGLSADAYHETSPDPSGSGVARAVLAALADAGLPPEAIGYFNAHGTGTVANDPAEWRAIQEVFGERARSLPVSSTKAAIGHAQGAAGVLETIATILALQRRLLLPTLRFGRPRRDCPGDPVGEACPRPATYQHAVCSNSAFGGSNAALVVSGGEPAAARQPFSGRPATGSLPGMGDLRTALAVDAPLRPVRVAGVGVVAAHGLELAALERALASGERPGRRVPDFAIERLVRRCDPRGMDPSSRYLTAAAALALEDAGVRLTGPRRDRTGLLAGINAISPRSEARFRDSIAERGLSRLSATAFARMVLNAPAGTCSAALSIRGPLSTLCIGDGSGLLALTQAAQLLAGRQELEQIVAGGIDELGEASGPELGEGAACLLLSAGPPAASWPRVAGWALGGPGHLDDAVRRALGNAGLPAEALDGGFGEGGPPPCLPALPWCDPAPVLGRAAAAGSAFAAAAAVLALRQGRCRRALITAGRGRSAAVALILTLEADHGC